MIQRDMGDGTYASYDEPQEGPYAPITPQQDLEARWRPSKTAVNHAVALLKAEPRADYAIVPMILPGKQHGIWTLGQKVETVPGIVLLGVNHFAEDNPYGGEVPSYSWARNESWEIAKRHLCDRSGTTGYATIRPDGTWAVFED